MRYRQASRRLILVPCLAAMTACDLVDPWLAPGAEQFAPPAVYESWWSMVESCSGISRSMNAVAFYVVRGAYDVPLEDGTKLAAYWSPAGDLIVIAEYYQMSGPVVRHEMLHALLRRTGHPREMFLDRCAGVNYCGPSCQSEAGPPPVPPASITRVPPSQLVVGLEVSPQAPRLSDQDGFFSITVTARNPSAGAVFVDVTAGYPVFSLEFSGSAGSFFQNYSTLDVERFLFAAGETKRQVYDFRIGPRDATDWAYPAGEYVMRGAYGYAWSPSRALSLAP